MGGGVKPDSQLADSPRDERVRDGHDKRTERILEQGRALARAMAPFHIIEPTKLSSDHTLGFSCRHAGRDYACSSPHDPICPRASKAPGFLTATTTAPR